MASREERAVKWTLTLSFLVLFIFAVVLVIRNKPSGAVIDQQREDQQLLDTILQTAPTKGPADATVAMVEFSDFQCPYCKTVEPLLDRAATEYAQIRRVWVHAMNRAEHPEAQNAATAAQCAHEQGKFWEYRSQLFANQDTLSTTTYNQIAQSLGLSTNVFQACLANPATQTIVNSHDQFARRTNVVATPHVMVNNTPLTGLFSYEDLKSAIDRELTRVTAP